MGPGLAMVPSWVRSLATAGTRVWAACRDSSGVSPASQSPRPGEEVGEGRAPVLSTLSREMWILAIMQSSRARSALCRVGSALASSPAR